MLRLSLAVAALVTCATVADASACAARETMVEKLSGLGERQTGLGLTAGGPVLEIWASEASGSWTVVLSHPSGMSCIMSHGMHWTAPDPEILAPVGAPT